MNQLDEKAIAVLRELQTATGRKLIAELVDLYVTSTPEVVRKMRMDLEKKAFKDLAREAHSLKSSSANLGVKVIEGLAKAIEISIVKNQSTNEIELSNWIGQIEKAFDIAVKELKAL